MGYTADVREFVPVPTGDYPARIKEYKLVTDGQYGPQLCFTMNIGKVADMNGVVDDFEDRTLGYWTPASISSGNKLGHLLGACGFDVPESGEQFDIDNLLNKPVLLAVLRGVKKSDGKTPNNTITSVVKYVQKVKVNGAAEAPALPDAPKTQAEIDSELPF